MFHTNVVEEIKTHISPLINFFTKLCFLCDNEERYCTARQATVRFAWWVIEVTHALTICNIYCFSTATMVKRTHHHVTLYVRCLFCSMLRPIAVHIHTVFCVPCTACDNVQQCADGYCHPLAVAAVRLEMRCSFSTRALRAQCKSCAPPDTAHACA
jgi:hypothetical protein